MDIRLTANRRCIAKFFRNNFDRCQDVLLGSSFGREFLSARKGLDGQRAFLPRYENLSQ